MPGNSRSTTAKGAESVAIASMTGLSQPAIIMTGAASQTLTMVLSPIHTCVERLEFMPARLGSAGTGSGAGPDGQPPDVQPPEVQPPAPAAHLRRIRAVRLTSARVAKVEFLAIVKTPAACVISTRRCRNQAGRPHTTAIFRISRLEMAKRAFSPR